MKIYKPNDFQAPSVDRYRSELISNVDYLIQKGDFKRYETHIEVTIDDNDKYSRENLIDFCSNYATEGDWSEVNSLRSSAVTKSGEEIRFEFYF